MPVVRSSGCPSVRQGVDIGRFPDFFGESSRNHFIGAAQRFTRLLSVSDGLAINQSRAFYGIDLEFLV